MNGQQSSITPKIESKKGLERMALAVAGVLVLSLIASYFSFQQISRMPQIHVPDLAPLVLLTLSQALVVIFLFALEHEITPPRTPDI